MTVPTTDRRTGRTTAALFVSLFVIYNANGREIGTVDSQPAKFTARELALRGTLVLDRVVAERPGLAERAAFARDLQGHVRSAYPLPSALIAAVPATLLHYSGLVDLEAPLGPNLVAALTASLLTAAAVTALLRDRVCADLLWFYARAQRRGSASQLRTVHPAIEQSAATPHSSAEN